LIFFRDENLPKSADVDSDSSESESSASASPILTPEDLQNNNLPDVEMLDGSPLPSLGSTSSEQDRQGEAQAGDIDPHDEQVLHISKFV
jgi:hypothetical protein